MTDISHPDTNSSGYPFLAGGSFAFTSDTGNSPSGCGLMYSGVGTWGRTDVCFGSCTSQMIMGMSLVIATITSLEATTMQRG